MGTPSVEMLRKTAWKKLFRNINNNNCILILGPGLATIEEDNGQRVPLSMGFAHQLIKDLKDEHIPYDPSQSDNLPYVGLRWIKQMPGVNRDDLQHEFKDFCLDYCDDIPDVYQQLAALPFSMVINTSPDDYMHQAFKKAGKESHLLYFDFHKNHASLVPEVGTNEPIVYNLFGYFEHPKSIVITKEDQVDFINAILRNVSVLPHEILQHFDKEKTYLFLGFDTTAWHLPLLFRSLKIQDTQSAYYLDQNLPKTANLHFYEQDYFKFQFIGEVANGRNVELSSFVEELNQCFSLWQDSNEQTDVDEVATTAYISKPQPGVSGKAKVLIMTSAPKDTQALELEEEINAIEDVHLESPQRDLFQVKPLLNIRKRKLLRILLRQKPQIVHFSGHGVGEEGLLFYGESGMADHVQGKELANLFKQFNDIVSCVVLNACFSNEQAQTIAQYIPNVIGTDHAIGDELALMFSEGFYAALFAGEEYERAYQMVMAHVGLANFPPGGRPIFYKNGQLIEND